MSVLYNANGPFEFLAFSSIFIVGNDIKLERGCLDGKKEEERQEGCIFIDLYYFTCTTVCLESFCLHTPPQVTSTTYEEAGIDIHSNGWFVCLFKFDMFTP